jgi:nitrite reductase (NO-forming)
MNPLAPRSISTKDDLASAQGGFVEMVFEEPGRYTFVNHSFVEMERGAKGFIEVTT